MITFFLYVTPIQTFNNRYTVIKKGIVQTDGKKKHSHCIKDNIKCQLYLHMLFNNIKESRILLHTYQDLMQNTQKYEELGSVS